MASLNGVLWFNELGLKDLPRVGGKNASLGEMFNQLTAKGIQVPNGFAVTVDAYQQFLKRHDLVTKIQQALTNLNVEDINALTRIGAQIRSWIMSADLLPEIIEQVTQAWYQLETQSEGELSVAVRSSATAEDLPDASFAGQQETLLNVRGLPAVLDAIKRVYASLYNDRAIAYRAHHQFDQYKVGLSVAVQCMVRSDKAASGVMFTLDTESGFDQVVLITSSYGLGETIVQGAVNPDEFYIYKPALSANVSAILWRSLGSKLQKMVYSQHPDHLVDLVEVDKAESNRFSLNDKEIEQLAQQAMIIEQHYGRPMDIEWAKDGVDGKLYIVQARPETVKSRETIGNASERYILKQRGKVLTQGRSIGQRIGKGKARIIKHLRDMAQLQPGDVLITDMTDPDWEPVMKQAAAIVTNRGGRTCHAAIIARELGVPAVVGCGNATDVISAGEMVTVSCAEGDTGFIYAGGLEFEIRHTQFDKTDELPVKISLNVGNPERAFAFRNVPNDGVGLARLEFIISNCIGIHPQALLEFAKLPNEIKQQIEYKIAAYGDPIEYYIEKLKEGIAMIAAAFYPKPVIVRLSDFKSNEYANLLGGQLYEPQEENPMLGFRGASRYLSTQFRECFRLECEALKRVRNEMKLTNVQIMVPFVRTVEEGKKVMDLLENYGLKRGENALKIIMMCELPSNALLADKFLDYFDGFSIGSNDLTQLTLGLDRDSGLVAQQFDERNEAVKTLLRLAIQACNRRHKYIGICGQGPSDYPDFADWLINEGIGNLSLNPDSVLNTYIYLLEKAASINFSSSAAINEK